MKRTKSFGGLAALGLAIVALALTACPEPGPLNGISVTTKPKTFYIMGDAFSAAGLVVSAAYSDGTSKKITDYTLTWNGAALTDGNTAVTAATGRKDITISYQGKTTILTITVGVNTVTSVRVNPQTPVAKQGEKLTFTAMVIGINNPIRTVTWSVDGNKSNDTVITENGILSVAADEFSEAIKVTATSTADTTQSASTIVTIALPKVSRIIIKPDEVGVVRGRSIQLSAIVEGENNFSKSVKWSISGNSAGTTLSDIGLLSVDINETKRNILITATSVFDPSVYGTRLVNTAYVYKKHTLGLGIPIFLYGGFFDANDLLPGGEWETAASEVAERILACPVIRDFKNYFDIFVFVKEDETSGIPSSGPVDRIYEMESAKNSTLSGDEASRSSMIFIANGMIGGFAVPDWYAAYSHRNDPMPFFWTLHEFMGHAFVGLNDEYESGTSALSCVYQSETKPSKNQVPWGDFIERPGYEEIGLFKSDTHYSFGYYWRSADRSFMRHTGDYSIPGYHRYLIYRRIMERAGIVDSGDQYLQAFFAYDTVNIGKNWDDEFVDLKP
jgi:hypothetical protein